MFNTNVNTLRAKNRINNHFRNEKNFNSAMNNSKKNSIQFTSNSNSTRSIRIIRGLNFQIKNSHQPASFRRVIRCENDFKIYVDKNIYHQHFFDVMHRF